MATDPAEYMILGMNVNGDTKAGMREKRKLHIADVLTSQNPLVVCLQEFLWKSIHSRAFKDIDVPDYFQCEGHREASFIFDTREITYSRIDNKKSVRNMYDSMVRRSAMSSDYFELSRFCVCKIKSKGAPNFEILCACWHGPHKVSMVKKEKALDTLVEFLLQLKVEEGNVPLLLGGDFNMPASTVERGLPDCLMLNTPDASSIDMFIMSSDMGEMFSISNVHTMKENSAFGHLHLEINLKTVNDTNLEEHNPMPPTYNPQLQYQWSPTPFCYGTPTYNPQLQYQWSPTPICYGTPTYNPQLQYQLSPTPFVMGPQPKTLNYNINGLQPLLLWDPNLQPSITISMVSNPYLLWNPNLQPSITIPWASNPQAYFSPGMPFSSSALPF